MGAAFLIEVAEGKLAKSKVSRTRRVEEPEAVADVVPLRRIGLGCRVAGLGTEIGPG